MSTYWAVNGVTSTLHDLLEEHITYSEDLQIQGVGVSTESPRRLRSTLAADKRGISIWLYRVTRNPDLLNAAPERTGPSHEDATRRLAGEASELHQSLVGARDLGLLATGDRIS